MKKILVVATGSVAVIKTKKLIDLLRSSFDVKVITSDYVKQNFNKYEELNALEEKPSLDSFPLHIELAKWADLIVVAPASANTLAKFNAGIADNFALTTLLAARSKILFAPAMNTFMYEAILERNIISQLSNLGHMFIGPNSGVLREGESGLGRMSEPDEIFETIKNITSDSPKKKVLISSGASRVHIDPVRYITNGSSGKFAKLIERELKLKGYEVKNVDISKCSNSEFIEYASNQEFDIYISAAAFADYDVETSQTKIKKNTIDSIKLLNNIDVLTSLKQKFPSKIFVGFKLDDDKQNAIDKMNKLGLDFMLWNKIGAMGNENISGALLFKEGEVSFENTSKQEVAKLLKEKL